MYFQINVTPKAKEVPKVCKEEPEPPAILILAPFQPPTRLKFETNSYTEVSTNLTIRNPTNRSLNVKVTKRPPIERSVILNCSDLMIDPDSESTLSLLWIPKKIGSWRDILQFTDSRRIKYDVTLTLICNGVKKGLTKGGAKTQILKQSDEVYTTNVGTRKILQVSNNLINKNMAVRINQNENKENIVDNSNTIMKSDHVNILSRETYTVDSEICTVSNLDISQFQLTPVNAYRDMKAKKLPKIQILDATSSNSMVNDSEKLNDVTEIRKLNSFEIDSTDAVPQIRILNATEMDFTPCDASIISPKVTDDGPALRRETYLNPEPKFCLQMVSIDETEVENFNDSLSPETVETKNESEIERNFSRVLDDIVNFTTPTKLISPAACSTGRKSNPDSQRLSDTESPSPIIANNTFEITDNSPKKLTSDIDWNLNKSPKSIYRARQIQPNRLTTTFDKISTMTEASNNREINLAPPSPKSIVNHRRVSLQSTDSTSVKSVLEADLWAKENNLPPSTSPSSSSRFNQEKFNDTLDMIAEETITVTKKIALGTNINNPKKFISTLRKSSGFCIEISPPKKVVNDNQRGGGVKKISPFKHNKITKDKTLINHKPILRKKIQETNSSLKQRNNVSTPRVKISKLCLKTLNTTSTNKSSKTIATIPLKNNLKRCNNSKISDSNCVISSIRNCDPFTATTTADPFLTHTLFYDDQWILDQELKFTKWLNALLTPPEHNADVETACIDVGKVWQTCRTKETNVTLAETKETVSARYHNINTRLNTLRKAACAMFTRDEVKQTLALVMGCIERGVLVIRQDRDLHRDIGLQKAILELLLSYNPLWLRIGLEVVYGETIPLNSNNDLIGLTRFLITRFFSDPYLVQTYSHPNVISLRLPAFQSQMNKFLLKKFLFIVYFLDYAKQHKLIGHDPCLFHKKALNKDSRSILLTFSREVLSGVGDITKILRTYRYIVTHKQTYLDEYNYAVKDISSDLRDGVRLCRIMELIIGDKTLTNQCRVPSISRLQKIHNVDVALKALIKAGYQIAGDIDAKSIVDGHREKTLSLLWQIIYKFQRPRFEKSAITLQKWWRAMLWYVRVKNYVSQYQNNAACVIQRSWRCYQAKKLTQQLRVARTKCLETMEKSIRIIQLKWIHRRKMLHDRYNFLQMKAATVRIQRWFRRIRVSRPYLQDLQKKRQAVIILQCQLRATIIMRRERTAFKNIKQATMIIQRWWRATSFKRSTQNYYQKLRTTIIFIQSKWRANRQMKIERNCYIKTRVAIIKIQMWWRNVIITKRLRNNYILQKNAANVIKSWWIYGKLMRAERKKFLNFRNNAIAIQRFWRQYRDTKNYILLLKSYRKATKIIQTWWRSVKHAREYRVKRSSAIVIQRWWRSSMITRTAASTFLLVKKSTINIQKTWKMKRSRRKYLKLKDAAQIIQSHYRSTQKMRKIRREFILKRNAILRIQSWWCNLKLTRECQQKYLTYRQTVIFIQTRWRAKIHTTSTRQKYLKFKAAAIKIQSYWRMIRLRRIYLEKLKQHRAALVLQEKWRAKKLGQKVRENYMKKKAATILIQRKYRAMKLCHSTRKQFLIIRHSSIILQKNWRMFKARTNFEKLKTAVMIIQIQWRAQKLAVTVRQSFVTLRNSVIIVQRRYRALRIGREIRKNYLMTHQAILIIQRNYRAIKLMQKSRKNYLEYREAVIYIQSTWRMIQAKRKYRIQFYAAVIIQRTWRRIINGRIARNYFLTLKASTIFIQRRYRSLKLSQKIQRDYNELRTTVIWIQKIWRSKKLMREQNINYIKEKKRNNAAIIIQAYWRGYKIRKLQTLEIKELRQRSKKAAQAATSVETVEYRLKAAMNLLQNFTNIGQLSMCLACLDTLTRLSPKGCVLFCELNLIDRLYLILERANRSLPWMEVCKRCSNILITLAKLPQTAAHVRNIEETETIARLMNTALKYDTDLFLHLATLFWILLNNSEFAVEVKNTERTIWLVKTLIISATKKETAASMKLKNDKSNSFLSQSMLLPNLKPDWGLQTRRSRCFTTIQHAITVIAQQLNITPT